MKATILMFLAVANLAGRVDAPKSYKGDADGAGHVRFLDYRRIDGGRCVAADRAVAGLDGRIK